MAYFFQKMFKKIYHTITEKILFQPHFYIGHGGSWRAYNQNVEENAQEVLKDPSCEKQIALEAKLLKLKE